MIKLIVSDLDGTLLNNEKHLPRDFETLLKKLSSHNIKFIAASGRPIYTLKENFSKYNDRILFIGDNGGVVEVSSSSRVVNLIDKALVLDVIKKFREIHNPNLHIVLCTPDCAYVETSDEGTNKEIDIYYINKEVVENVEAYADKVVKITFYEKENIETITAKHFKPYFDDTLHLAIAGSVWLDIMAKGTNKGIALKELQEKLCILPQETMVFGDYFNDIEMFEHASYSYAMQDAPDAVKAAAKFVIGSNEENAVVNEINSFIDKYLF